MNADRDAIRPDDRPPAADKTRGIDDGVAPADLVAHLPDAPPDTSTSSPNGAADTPGASPPPGGLKALADLTLADQDDLYFIPGVDDAAADGDKPGASLKRTRSDWTPHALADAVLDAALPRDVIRKLMRGDAIAVVIAVPGADWVDPIAGALRRLSDRVRTVVRDGSNRREHVSTKGNDAVSDAMFKGHPIVGVSQAPAAFLPSTLIAIADATAQARPPDGGTLLRIMRRTGIRPVPRAAHAAPCAGMSYHDILAAFRRGATGRDILANLAKMSARMARTDADDGVPALPDLPGFSGEARTWGTTLIGDFADWRTGNRGWRDVSASAVLAGPPGTGKTMFARSLAKALGVPLISTGVGDWFARTEGHLGDVAKAFQDVWDRAMAARPCVLFIDELDAIPDRATLSNRGRDWWLPIITLMLTTTDGVQTARDGLVLMGATNHGDHIDAALVRKGRFDRLIQVDLPTPDDLAAVVSHHLDGAIPARALTAAVRAARGASAADAAAWAREARTAALVAGRTVSVADVANAAAPPDDRSADDLRRCAIHEAGHALVGHRLGARVEAASIVSVGQSGGFTHSVRGGATSTSAQVDLSAKISLGGRAAEQAILGDVTDGAEADLAKVTALIAGALASVGLGDSLVHRAPSEGALVLVNQDRELRAAVEARMRRLYADTLAMVEADKAAILRIADALFARRHLTGDEIRALADDAAKGGQP